MILLLILAAVLAIIISVTIIVFGYLTTMSRTPPKIVDIKELIENPENYVGELIRVQGWLSDTGKTDVETILVPASRGVMMRVPMFPITDTDYYYIVYPDVSRKKGTLIRLEVKRTKLIGKLVNATGVLKMERIKQNGDYQNVYVIYGDVELSSKTDNKRV